jgi:hypothetical protein
MSGMDDSRVTTRARWLLVLGVVLVLAAAAAGVLWVRRSTSTAGSPSVPVTVVLQAADDAGTDSFVPVPAGRPVAVTHPHPSSGTAITATVEPDTGVRLVAGTTDHLYAAGRPGNPELYGGSGSLSACDPAAIAAFLAAHPDKAAAWAQVRGIEPADIAGYLGTLTPVVLLHDTLVTNHGFAGGVATAFTAVLQAGTAVLVDPTGLPVVRCACGNPLTAPPAVDLSAATQQGTRWDGYDPAQTVVVTSGPAATQLVVVDAATGQDLTLTVGPAPAATSTAPTTDSTPAAASTACVLDLTWPLSAPGWIDPLDSGFTCQQMTDQWRRNEQWTGVRGGTLALVTFDDGWYCTGVHWDPTAAPTNAVGGCDLNGQRFTVYQGEPGQRAPSSTAPSSTAPSTARSTVGSSTGASGAATTGVDEVFITPSQNIVCARRDGQFACTVKQYDFDLGDERCPGALGPLAQLDATGFSQVSSCRGDFFDGITLPDPTPYGTTLTLDQIRCDVEESGVTCTNQDGHGFTMSRAGVPPF